MSALIDLPINEITIKDNYRKTFNEKSLKQLAQSINENGVLEPVIVREQDGFYELIAGERRIRACLLIGLVTIPAIVKQGVSDEDFYKFQLIENIQRENVAYMEEARGLANLRERCAMDVSEISAKLGKSESLIYFLLNLTRMPPIATEAAENGEFTRSVAMRIARLPNDELIEMAAKALRRKQKDKLVSDRFARNYIEEILGSKKLLRKQKNEIQKVNGHDYAANWKQYLISFTSEQFEQFKSVCNGRTETSIMAEAVESVMLEACRATLVSIPDSFPETAENSNFFDAETASSD